MKAVKFPEANHLIIPTLGSVTESPMHVYTDGMSSTSVWRLTDEDIKALAEGKHLYIILGCSPDNHPAIGISAENFLPEIKSNIIIP